MRAENRYTLFLIPLYCAGINVGPTERIGLFDGAGGEAVGAAPAGVASGARVVVAVVSFFCEPLLLAG